jgi:hypothetical protein
VRGDRRPHGDLVQLLDRHFRGNIGQ